MAENLSGDERPPELKAASKTFMDSLPYEKQNEDLRAMVPAPTPPELPDNSQVINHGEAEQLAHLKKGESNLARCYLELLADVRRLRSALPQAPAPSETPHLRGSRCRYVFPSTGTLCMSPIYMCSHPQPKEFS